MPAAGYDCSLLIARLTFAAPDGSPVLDRPLARWLRRSSIARSPDGSPVFPAPDGSPVLDRAPAGPRSPARRDRAKENHGQSRQFHRRARTGSEAKVTMDRLADHITPKLGHRMTVIYS